MIVYSKMNVVNSVESNNKDDKIETILNMLRNQVDQYNTVKEDNPSEPKLTTDQRIQQLVMEEKQLSTQFQKVRKELRFYERKYEKMLKKRVRHIKIQIKEDLKKLKEIKEKYFELHSQLETESSTLEKAKEKESEEASNPLNVNTLSSQLKQNDIPLSSKIKISIKKNENSCSSEIHFVHDINGQNAFTNLVEIVKPVALNTRECKIILQKLTEEQINKYIDQKRLGQPQIEYKEITQDCLQEINKSIVCPKWHIKIPRSVFEESQKESRKSISEESQKESRKSISEESQKESRKSITEESQKESRKSISEESQKESRQSDLNVASCSEVI
ncbi:mRNA export factor GLE1-like [Bombus huntii]|uniref:mRNA export factor GLE1-like n=1 Tax=Bombus huntii TaxID=85661 RepID=UPI0021AAA91F|nr:mRNA export factor GLE1-like [Bombus huntii]